MIEFKPWPKTPRLFRDVVISEKIDGTNAAVHVEIIDPESAEAFHRADVVIDTAGRTYRVAAQSRNRLLTPEADNYGFARYVRENAAGLVTALGLGTHYGEWWGSGIQRGYGLKERRFSLFNVDRHGRNDLSAAVPGLGVVPVLYRGPFSTETVDLIIDNLEAAGSRAVYGWPTPEGVVVYHTAARRCFKVLIENDDRAKSDIA